MACLCRMNRRVTFPCKVKARSRSRAKASLNRATEYVGVDPKPCDLPVQGEGAVTRTGGPNPRMLKNAGMRWGSGEIQSNSEIAGSPRNSFRASLGMKSRGGRALIGCGARKGYQAQSNSECHRLISGSQTVSAKIHCQRKQPRPSAKVPKCVLSGKGCGVAQTTRMLA